MAPAGTTGLVVTYAISSFGAGQGDALVQLDDISVTSPPVGFPEGGSALALLGIAFAGLELGRRKFLVC